MYPEGVQIVGALGVFLLLIAALVAGLPVSECDQCEHCRRERLKRAGRLPK